VGARLAVTLGMQARTFRGLDVDAAGQASAPASKPARAFEELDFAPPSGWAERTIVSFGRPSPFGAKAGPSVVLVRERLEAHQTLLHFALRHAAQLLLVPRSAGFIDLNGTSVYHVVCELQTERGDLERTITFLEA